MNRYKLVRRFWQEKIHVLFILAIIGFSFLYFYLYRLKNQELIYVSVMLVDQKKASNVVPNFIAEAINKNDTEISLFTGKLVEVIDKEEYEAGLSGKNVFLLLMVKAEKDKTKSYLYKNRPLLVGGVIGMKLNKTQVDGIVTYMGTNPPSYKENKLRVRLKAKELDSWLVENIKIGSKIQGGKGKIIAEVIDKKLFLTNPVIVKYESGGNQFVLRSDPDKRDCELTVDILTVRIDDYDYYARTQKVKIGESLYLPFKEASFTGTVIFIDWLN